VPSQHWLKGKLLGVTQQLLRSNQLSAVCHLIQLLWSF
jgi:hypothetical protein